MSPFFQRRRWDPPPATRGRLHVGCGQEAIPGWINVDIRKLPGVDRVVDVTEGLPFSGLEAIYAEHFLEHLSLEQGLGFLAECRRALAEDGTLRLSTPNLDWVYATHYRTGRAEREALVDCMQLNRAFRGWGHRFLYNRSTLAGALSAVGLSGVTFHQYGQSDRPALANLERHETWHDTADLPHVLIAEASRARDEQPGRPRTEDLMAEWRRSVDSG
jgi:predicted SAM-dependent methyltransferase